MLGCQRAGLGSPLASLAPVVLLCLALGAEPQSLTLASGGTTATLTPLPTCKSVAAESWIDMSSWVQAGRVPMWEVKKGGRTLWQYMNAPNAGFYVSNEDDIIDVVVQGTIGVMTQKNSDNTSISNDNDFIGFAMGLQSPLPGSIHDYDAMLYSWGGVKGLTDTLNHPYHTLHKLNGTIPQGSGHCDGAEGACFWYRFDDEPCNPSSKRDGCGYSCFDHEREKKGCFIAASTASTGWAMDTRYAFAALFTEERIAISINGDIKIDARQSNVLATCNRQSVKDAKTEESCRGGGKAWRKGRIAWYNLSQHGVEYGNIRLFRIKDKTAVAPVAGPDIYGVLRDSTQSSFLTVERPFYEGIIANDWSPILAKVRVQIAGLFSQNPKTEGTLVTPGQNKTQVCEYGSTLEVDHTGAFVYQPATDLVTRADSTGITVERCKYIVLDEVGQYSDETEITFALSPAAHTCPPEGCFIINWTPAEHPNSWYKTIQNQVSVFGQLSALGGCGPITEWTLSDGGAEGRFTLIGDKLAANDKDRIVLQFLRRTAYTMQVRARDVFNQMQTTTVTVVLPAECESRNACICEDQYSCRCLPGYNGTLCDKCEDSRMPIAQNPNCTKCAECPLTAPPSAAGVSGKCMYPEKRCDIFCHRDVTCSGHGNCTELPPGKCTCDLGWKGDACDKCDDHFYGPDCKIYCDDAVTCHGHGTCQMDGNCTCNPSYYPPGECSLSCTRDANCSSHGDCVFDGNGYPSECKCEDPWLGTIPYNPAENSSVPRGCSVRCEAQTNCSGHGKCNAMNTPTLGQCTCDTIAQGGTGNFAGKNCEECLDGWSPLGSCDVHCSRLRSCSGHGNCTKDGKCTCDTSDDLGYWKGDKCNECVEPYYGQNCTKRCVPAETCGGHPCDASGECLCPTGFAGNCSVCHHDYYGDNCSMKCDSCSGHGHCIHNATDLIRCDCVDEYYGDDCNVLCRPLTTCTGHGSCAQSGACKCTDFWFSDHCDVYCDPNVTCSGHGKCRAFDGKCTCDSGYQGDDCSGDNSPIGEERQPTMTLLALSKGAASDCPILEAGGTCVGWLLIMILLLLLCLLAAVWYVLFRKRKKKRNFVPCEEQEEPLLDDSEVVRFDLGDPDAPAKPVDFDGGSLDGFDPLKKPSTPTRFDLGQPEQLESNKPASHDPTRFDLGQPEAPTAAPDFTGADLGGFDPLGLPGANGAGQGPDFTGAALVADPLGAKAARAKGPLSSEVPDIEAGMVRAVCSKVVADDLLPPSDSAALTDGEAKCSKADGELKRAVMAALSSNLPADVKKDLEKAIDSSWAGGDMGDMDPLHVNAKRHGQTPEAVRSIIAQGALPAAAAAPLAAALKASDDAGKELRDTARGIVVKDPLGAPPLLTKLFGAPPGAALPYPLLPAAGQAKGLPHPPECLQPLDKPRESALGAAEKVKDALCKAVPSVPAAVTESVEKGTGRPLSSALSPEEAPGMAAVLLRQPGLPPATRSVVQDALAEYAAADKVLEDATRSVVQDTRLPYDVRETLEKALPGQGPVFTGADLNGMDPLARGAASRGKLPEAVRSVVQDTSIPESTKGDLSSALRGADDADAALQDAIERAAANPSTDPKLRQFLNDAWCSGDMDGMDPITKRGKAAVVARSALAQGGLPANEAKSLAKALGAADAAASALSTAAASAAVASNLPEHSKRTLQNGLGEGASGAFARMDQLQLRAVAYGKVPVSASAVLSDLPSKHKKAMEKALDTLGAGETALGDAARAVLKDASVSEAARRLLENALSDDSWGPASDLEGMDPLSRAALTRGQVPEAVRSILRQGDLPKAHQAKLKSLLEKVDSAHAKVDSTAREAVRDGSTSPSVKASVQQALDAGQGPLCLFDGNVSLSGMDAINKGVMFTAVKSVLQKENNAALQLALNGWSDQHQKLVNDVQRVIASHALPPEAKQQLQDALDGKVNFLYGTVDMTMMDPLKAPGGLVAEAVRGVVAKGGLPPQAAKALEEALQKTDSKEEALRSAAQQAVKKSSLSGSSKAALQDALYGKLPRAAEFTRAAVDLDSWEFAPLKPKNAPKAASSFVNFGAKPVGVGDATLANMAPSLDLSASTSKKNGLSLLSDKGSPDAPTSLLGVSPSSAASPLVPQPLKPSNADALLGGSSPKGMPNTAGADPLLGTASPKSTGPAPLDLL